MRHRPVQQPRTSPSGRWVMSGPVAGRASKQVLTSGRFTSDARIRTVDCLEAGYTEPGCHAVANKGSNMRCLAMMLTSGVACLCCFATLAEAAGSISFEEVMGL